MDKKEKDDKKELKREPEAHKEEEHSSKKKRVEHSSSSSEEEKPKSPRKKSDDKEEKKNEGKLELFVSNLPYSATEDTIEEMFAKYGKVTNVKLLKDNGGRSKGIAFVKFDDSAQATKGLEANEKELDGRKIRVNFAGEKPSGDRPERSENKFEKGSNQCTIFVGNMSFDSNKDSLEDLFKECGDIKDIRIPTRDDGKPRGFAHIEFANEGAVEKALKKNGTELDGRNIKVDVAGNKTGGSRGGDFHRGGGRGGFRGGRGGFRGGRGGNFHDRRSYDD